MHPYGRKQILWLTFRTTLSPTTVFHQVDADFYTYCYAIVNHWIVYGFFRSPDHDKEHTACVTGQQKMFNPSWHLILTVIYAKVRLALLQFCIFSFGLWFWTHPIFFFFETEEMLNYLNSKEKHFLNLTKINKN